MKSKEKPFQDPLSEDYAPSVDTKAARSWGEWVIPAQYLNTSLEQLFKNLNRTEEALRREYQKAIDLRYEIALRACPFYLGQMLWQDDGYRRTRVYVSKIEFQEDSPYYRFWIRDESGFFPIQKLGSLDFLAGVENHFTETLADYRARIEKLVAAKKITISPTGSSYGLEHLLAIVTQGSTADALLRIKPESFDAWYEKIFSIRNNSI